MPEISTGHRHPNLTGDTKCKLKTTPIRRAAYKPEKRQGYYVSWDAGDYFGGTIGKWFESKIEADICYADKKSEGLNPAKWYKEQPHD